MKTKCHLIIAANEARKIDFSADGRDIIEAIHLIKVCKISAEFK